MIKEMDEQSYTLLNREEIKDYLAKKIKDYWSDDFLIKDLSKFGIDEENAKILIEETRTERDVSHEKSLYDDASDNGKVTGGLAWACYLVAAGGIVSLTRSIIEYENNPWGIIDIIESGLFFLLAIYAVICILRKKPNGIFLMKSYLVLCFGSNLLGIITYESGDNYPIGKMLITMVLCTLFFTYFCSSGQVKELFPKKKRVVSWYDKGLVGLTSLPMVIALVVLIISSTALHTWNVDNTTMIDSSKKQVKEAIESYSSSAPIQLDEYSTLLGFDYDKENLMYCTINISLENYYPLNLEQLLQDYSSSIAEGEFVEFLKKAEVPVFLNIVDNNGAQILYIKI